MANVIPPIFLPVVTEVDGTDHPGKIVALSALRSGNEYHCPYCACNTDDMAHAGRFRLIVNDDIEIKCNLYGCENCMVFVYKPRFATSDWTAERMRSVEPRNFVQDSEFWEMDHE